MKRGKRKEKPLPYGRGSEQSRDRKGALATALLAALVLIFYWTPLTSASASIQWDAADMHYPFQKYFADRLWSGHLPFWTPYLFSGYPFLSNPEVGAWYLPHWPFFLAGITPRSIEWELALNAFLACLGAFLLIRRHEVSRPAAMLGGLFYGLSGFFAGHSPHVGLFCAAACFPWLLLAFRMAWERQALRYTALGGAAGGLMILAGYVQIAMYGFLALGLYAAALAWRERARWPRAAAILGGMLAGALALAAIQILPGLEATALSIRAGADYLKSTESVLHAAPLVTLILPDWLGPLSGNYHGPADITQYYFYAGFLLLPLAALGLRGKPRVAALALIVPALWFMAGPAGGFYRLAMLVPGLKMVRAPIQGWFVVALGLAMLAAAGADWIFGRWPAAALRVALVALVFVDVWYWNSRANPLAYAHNSFEDLYGAREQQFARRVAVTQPPLTRFDGPRYQAALGPLDHPLDVRLEATYGYFSLEPKAYDEYTEAMARNPRLRNGLNVSRVLNGTTGRLEPNPAVLPRAYFPKAVVDVRSADEARQALETLDPAAEAVVLGPHASLRQDAAATATMVGAGEQAYRVSYHAASASLLKLSVPWFPGWHARSGGAELPIMRVDYALMGVVVPAGTGVVDFRFEPDYFYLGMAISLAAALCLATCVIVGVRGKKS